MCITWKLFNMFFNSSLCLLNRFWIFFDSLISSIIKTLLECFSLISNKLKIFFLMLIGMSLKIIDLIVNFLLHLSFMIFWKNIINTIFFVFFFKWSEITITHFTVWRDFKCMFKCYYYVVWIWYFNWLIINSMNKKLFNFIFIFIVKC